MRIEVLGSGGAITTPRPGCDCRLCVEAREKGVPYSRSGPSLFVHGPNVIIDTPEESKAQLNRSQITDIAGCFYSHWHPDHVMGRRVWETRNSDWRNWPPRHHSTTIYLPQQVAHDFRTRMGIWEHMAFMAKHGYITIVELQDGDVVTLGDTTIRPFRVAEEYVYAFLFEESDRRVLIAPDELFRWTPPADVHGVDLAIIPMGVVEFDPFSGERRIPADHIVLTFEATFRQTLDMVRSMQPRRTIMTHIEEPDGQSYDDLLRLEDKLRGEGFNITFAYDTMLIEV